MFDSVGYQCHGLEKRLKLVLCGSRNPGLLAPGAAALLTLSGCSHPQGMEDSPALLRNGECGGGVATDSQTDIYRESGLKG